MMKIRTKSFALFPGDGDLRRLPVPSRRRRTRGIVRWEGAANALGAMFHRIGSFFDGGRPQ